MFLAMTGRFGVIGFFITISSSLESSELDSSVSDEEVYSELLVYSLLSVSLSDSSTPPPPRWVSGEGGRMVAE